MSLDAEEDEADIAVSLDAEEDEADTAVSLDEDEANIVVPLDAEEDEADTVVPLDAEEDKADDAVSALRELGGDWLAVGKDDPDPGALTLAAVGGTVEEADDKDAIG